MESEAMTIDTSRLEAATDDLLGGVERLSLRERMGLLVVCLAVIWSQDHPQDENAAYHVREAAGRIVDHLEPGFVERVP